MFYGQFGEDQYLNQFFPDSYIGSCVDVGAYDGISGNNTLYFEKKGWNCICIEPIPEQFQKCSKIREKCLECCISNDDKTIKKFTVFNLDSNQSAISSLIPDERLIKSHKNLITGSTEINVISRTLTSVLDEYNFGKDIDGKRYIDFISIDTENTELDVIKSLDFQKYFIKYFVIENNYDEPFIQEYLNPLGYKKIHRSGVNDFYVKI